MTGTRLGAGTLCLLAATGCGGSGDDGLADKRIASLSAHEKTQACERWQPFSKQLFQSLARVTCTDQARLKDDLATCNDQRAACMAKIPALDFDVCASPEAAARASEIFRTTFAEDAEFADLVDSIDPTRASMLEGLPASCPITVGQYQACLEALVSPSQNAGAMYTCEDGEQAAEFDAPPACNVFGQQAAMCTLPA